MIFSCLYINHFLQPFNLVPTTAVNLRALREREQTGAPKRSSENTQTPLAVRTRLLLSRLSQSKSIMTTSEKECDFLKSMQTESEGKKIRFEISHCQTKRGFAVTPCEYLFFLVVLFSSVGSETQHQATVAQSCF